jgi:hypothetical protein
MMKAPTPDPAAGVGAVVVVLDGVAAPPSAVKAPNVVFPPAAPTPAVPATPEPPAPPPMRAARCGARHSRAGSLSAIETVRRPSSSDARPQNGHPRTDSGRFRAADFLRLDRSERAPRCVPQSQTANPTRAAPILPAERTCQRYGVRKLGNRPCNLGEFCPKKSFKRGDACPWHASDRRNVAPRSRRTARAIALPWQWSISRTRPREVRSHGWKGGTRAFKTSKKHWCGCRSN